MENILIIKTSASGDVLRTTVLLHILKGNIFWITAGYNIPLFPDNHSGLTLIPAENIPSLIFELNFDLVINLEEDYDLAQRLSRVRATRILGIFFENGKLQYSSDSAEWFDMSLISTFPPTEANELKKNNIRSYQQMLFAMLAKEFSGEQYILYRNNNLQNHKRPVIGIEKRVGTTWPNKSWHGYDELITILQSRKHEVRLFEKRAELRQYLEDIDKCSLIISGDTLAMHIALGYQVPCVGLFNCTSAEEIHDYGVLKKLKSPLLLEAFYNRQFLDEVINSIPLTDVYQEIEEQVKNFPYPA